MNNELKEEKYYIVRGDKSGVFFGTIKERKGQEVELTNVRKLWYWNGAGAVEQLSQDGVTDTKGSKFTVIVESIIITDAIEILPCTEKAIKSIGDVKEWRA